MLNHKCHALSSSRWSTALINSKTVRVLYLRATYLHTSLLSKGTKRFRGSLQLPKREEPWSLKRTEQLHDTLMWCHLLWQTCLYMLLHGQVGAIRGHLNSLDWLCPLPPVFTCLKFVVGQLYGICFFPLDCRGFSIGWLGGQPEI